MTKTRSADETIFAILRVRAPPAKVRVRGELPAARLDDPHAARLRSMTP